MKKSKYIKQSTSNDLETFGYIETECVTVGEFIEDVTGDNKNHTFKFHIINTHHLKKLNYTWNEKIAYMKIENGETKEEWEHEEYIDEKIKAINYKDGWAGVDFEIFIEK